MNQQSFWDKTFTELRRIYPGKSTTEIKEMADQASNARASAQPVLHDEVERLLAEVCALIVRNNYLTERVDEESALARSLSRAHQNCDRHIESLTNIKAYNELQIATLSRELKSAKEWILYNSDFREGKIPVIVAPTVADVVSLASGCSIWMAIRKILKFVCDVDISKEELWSDESGVMRIEDVDSNDSDKRRALRKYLAAPLVRK